MTTPDTDRTDTADGRPAVGGARPPRRLHLRTLLVSVLVAGALLLILNALSNAGGEPVATRPPQFEVLEPGAEAVNVPGQSTVAVDLAFGWTGVLVIDGIEIPQDQLEYVRATARLSYSPGEGKELRRLPGGQVRVTAIVWPVTGTRALDAVEHTWYFDVT